MISPKISIVIPVYNAEKYVCQCLDSIIKQSLNEIEVICLNDGSSDSSLNILEEYAEQDDRIIVIDQKNQGVGKTRNNGINHSNGEFIAFMDPDDYYPKDNILETLYNNAIENNVLICGGSFCSFNNEKYKTSFINNLKKYRFDKNEKIKYKDYQFDYGYHRFIYNRLFLLTNKIYFPHYIRFQDPPFFVNAMVMAEEFYAIKNVTYAYRFNHKKIMWDSNKAIAVLKGMIDIFNLAKKHNLNDLYYLTFDRLVNEYMGRFNHINSFKYYLYLIYIFLLFDKNKINDTNYKKFKNYLKLNFRSNLKNISSDEDSANALIYKKRKFNRLLSFLYVLKKEKLNPKNIYFFYKARRQIKSLNLFDDVYYLTNYQDVRNSNMNPLDHYIYLGWMEKRSPSKKFNGNYYLRKYADVKKSKTNPLVHYVLHGKKEGRFANHQAEINSPQ